MKVTAVSFPLVYIQYLCNIDHYEALYKQDCMLARILWLDSTKINLNDLDRQSQPHGI